MRKSHVLVKQFLHGLSFSSPASVPGEDVEAYREYCGKWFDYYQAAGDFERRLVQIIADTSWRLARAAQVSMELREARDLNEISRWEERLAKHLTRVRRKLDETQGRRKREFELGASDPSRRPN